MINAVYQLVYPKAFAARYEQLNRQGVLVRPDYMAICHADQRYYLGQRDEMTLRKKLPMALIHECCGIVEDDPTGNFTRGERVVMIPNTPPASYPDYIYENYAKGAFFRSSGHDGFMRELVQIPPDRVIPAPKVAPATSAITEFVSVAVHGVTRFLKAAHPHRDIIGVWGDGSLGFVVALVLRNMLPGCRIIVVGRHSEKLARFSFVDECVMEGSIPSDFSVDHGFECTGGEGSASAIDEIIDAVNPQGTMILMGVSENKVAVRTRMVLEKGLTLVGVSRSGRADFLEAARIMDEMGAGSYLDAIVYVSDPVQSIDDIHKAFAADLVTPFKTAFKWEL